MYDLHMLPSHIANCTMDHLWADSLQDHVAAEQRPVSKCSPVSLQG
jgi:hypothetical protein